MKVKKHTKKDGIKRIVFEVPTEQHKEIKLAATTVGMTIKDFVDGAIIEKILREKKELKKVRDERLNNERE